MIRCPVLGTTVSALEGPSDRIVRFPVAELHDPPRDAGTYLAEVHGGATKADASQRYPWSPDPRNAQESGETPMKDVRGPGGGPRDVVSQAAAHPVQNPASSRSPAVGVRPSKVVVADPTVLGVRVEVLGEAVALAGV
jgi:hypothetical protein